MYFAAVVWEAVWTPWKTGRQHDIVILVHFLLLVSATLSSSIMAAIKGQRCGSLSVENMASVRERFL